MAKTKLIDTNTLRYYHLQIKALLGNKVDKIDGKSLISDSEINRLSNIVNYNDTEVKAAISTMESQISDLQSGTYDDTQLKANIASTYATITSLSNHLNDDTVHILSGEREKWNTKADTADLITTLTTAKSYTDSSINTLEANINAKLTSAMHYKGSVSNYSALPSDPQVGDFYNIVAADITHGVKAGDNAAWNGTDWDITSGSIDLSDYYSVTDVASNTDIDTIVNS